MPEPDPRWRGRARLRTCAAALALLAVFAALAAAGSRHDAVTVDEFAIVPSGLAKLLRPGEVNWLNPVNPPLGQLAVGLPLLASGARLPAAWLDVEQPELRWEIGARFMHENRDAYLALFARARCVTIVLGILLCALVFAWSREAFGAAGSWVSLGLCATCPNLLAHGHLATVDLAFSLATFGSTYALWRLLRAGRGGPLRRWGPYAFGVAAALATKFTFLLLVPVHLALVAAAAARSPGRRRELAAGLAGVALVGLVAVGALYGFEGVGTPVGRLAFESSPMRALQATPLGLLPSPLPEWYLRGLDLETARIEQRRNQFFLRGEVYDEPRPEYFGYALLVKTPLPHLLALAAAVATVGAAAVRGPRGRRREREAVTTLLVTAGALLAVFSFLVGANLGVRYVLPVLPLLYVLAGILGRWGRRRMGRGALAALVAVGAAAALSSAPRFLSSFNILAGGGAGGFRHLSDSNLDWGQDLRDLRATMEARGIRRVALSYFGLVDPSLYGVEAVSVWQARPGDVVAISVHHLNGIAPFEPPPPGLVERLRRETPLARAGDSIFLYRLPP